MTRRRLPWLLFGVLVAIFVGLALDQRLPGEDLGDLVWLLPFLAYGAVGAFVASRRMGNRIGLVFLAIGLFGALAALGDVHVRAPVDSSTTAWEVVGVGLGVLAALGWIGAIGTILTFSLLLFPDGRLPSRRWRPVAWLAVIAIPLLALSDIALNFDIDPGLTGLRGALELVGGGLFLVAAVASVASLVVRFRRAGPEQREQLKWIVAAASFVAVVFLATVLVEEGGGEGTVLARVLGLVSPLAISGIPLSAGIAIVRYRLYDIDVVINKAVVYGTLAAFITALYVGVVVGLGRLVGAGERPNLALSVGATALVAVLFQPVRARVQRFANRLVYGKRASPYELLSRFSDRVAGSYAAEDVLERLARVVAEGTGGRVAGVWLQVGEELHPAASWPADEGLGDPVPATDPPAIEGADRTFPVREGQQLIGALTVTKAAGDPLRPAEERLSEDIASQAGLVLRNVRLTAELQRRLDEISRQAEELRASRRRIVAAQDRERRRLERDIHDGAQQHLVALAVNVNLARAMARKDPERARETVEALERAAHDALTTLRDLAGGIYPPVLAAEGLGGALRAQTARSSLPVEIRADGVARLPHDVEAAAYFSVLEGLQNAAKYADASRIVVDVRAANGDLLFEVVDDGRGFDPATTPPGSGLQNIADRLAVLGGSVAVVSAPGRGTTVTGRIPIPDREGMR